MKISRPPKAAIVLRNKYHLFYECLAVLSGALLPLAFAPVNWFFLAVFSPLLAFFSWHGVRPGVAARRGLLFGLGFFGVGVSWVYVAVADYTPGITRLHLFGEAISPEGILVAGLFVALLSLFITLQAYLGARLQHRLSLAWHGLVFATVWMLFEWLRGWVLTGFPWLDLGYSQIISPLAGYAPVLGSYGVSLMVVLTAAGLWQWLQRRDRFGYGLLVGLLVIWLGGWGLTFIKWSHPTGKPIKVALVQGNLPQLTKWDPSKILYRLDFYADLSRPYWGKVDAIVWPENAMTIFWQDAPQQYRKDLEQHVKQSGTDLVIGLPYENEKTGQYYSSLLVLGKTPGVYNKRHLVPFGEYVPLASELRGLIKFFNLPMSSFSPGAPDQKHLEIAGQPMAPSICYEDAFGSELLRFLPQATVLINGSNNAWYGRSLAPYQHLQISSMRALETSREEIRATTTGISALVNQHGRVIKRSPEFKSYVLTGKVQPRQGATPYVRTGNWPVVSLIFVLLGILVLRSRWSRQPDNVN
ncbi:MAG: apolipoprotein N-acyltransferase [Gammaproteobacteria bacterium]|jgi:apolipoprotein N-acyltransferase